MIVLNYQPDLVRIRHRSEKSPRCSPKCGFSLICALCMALLFISQSSESRTLQKLLVNLLIKKIQQNLIWIFEKLHFLSSVSSFHILSPINAEENSRWPITLSPFLTMAKSVFFVLSTFSLVL